jgi:hypothetical protein
MLLEPSVSYCCEGVLLEPKVRTRSRRFGDDMMGFRIPVLSAELERTVLSVTSSYFIRHFATCPGT